MRSRTLQAGSGSATSLNKLCFGGNTVSGCFRTSGAFHDSLPDISASGHWPLDTDNDTVGLGTMLSQIVDGGEKVVAYYSRALDRQEQN